MLNFLIIFLFFLIFQYAIKLASKRNEKKLSAIAELTDDRAIKIIEIGRDKDRDKDNRDREREWNYKNNHHINNNHQQSKLVNHTSHVSIKKYFFCYIKINCYY